LAFTLPPAFAQQNKYKGGQKNTKVAKNKFKGVITKTGVHSHRLRGTELFNERRNGVKT
jgi:hypothetical protein